MSQSIHWFWSCAVSWLKWTGIQLRHPPKSKRNYWSSLRKIQRLFTFSTSKRKKWRKRRWVSAFLLTLIHAMLRTAFTSVEATLVQAIFKNAWRSTQMEPTRILRKWQNLKLISQLCIGWKRISCLQLEVRMDMKEVTEYSIDRNTWSTHSQFAVTIYSSSAVGWHRV